MAGKTAFRPGNRNIDCNHGAGIAITGHRREATANVKLVPKLLFLGLGWLGFGRCGQNGQPDVVKPKPLAFFTID